MNGPQRRGVPGRTAERATGTGSPAAQLARLKLTYGPRWHITATIPGTGPRILTATETGTGQRIQARSEHEMAHNLAAITGQAQPPACTECTHLCG